MPEIDPQARAAAAAATTTVAVADSVAGGEADAAAPMAAAASYDCGPAFLPGASEPPPAFLRVSEEVAPPVAPVAAGGTSDAWSDSDNDEDFEGGAVQAAAEAGVDSMALFSRNHGTDGGGGNGSLPEDRRRGASASMQGHLYFFGILGVVLLHSEALATGGSMRMLVSFLAHLNPNWVMVGGRARNSESVDSRGTSFGCIRPPCLLSASFFSDFVTRVF